MHQNVDYLLKMTNFLLMYTYVPMSPKLFLFLINNDIVDNFQYAYKACHSYETDLLRVYNDLVSTICRCNGAIFVLHDVSAVFQTIDHDNLFEKYVDFVEML